MQIRKANLKYVKCKGGEMHNGQVMNLVCVDQRCNYRGLICPICKIQTHDDHYILPIKAFLDEISKTFLKKEENDQVNTIGDYLRALENTRKELLAIIKNQIIELSNLFKQLQCKVEDVYLSLRRNILIQSTINTKLPSLVELMRKENNYDDFDIQHQFKKYCELLKFKDSKLTFSDKSKKIVNLFSETPKKFDSKVKVGLDLFKNQIKQQISLLDIQNISKQLQKDELIFKFSGTNKDQSVMLNHDKTQVTTLSKGFVFLDTVLSSQNNKFTFSVLSHQYEEIIVGVGDLNKFKQYKFANNEDLSCIQMFVSSNGENSLHLNDGSASQSSDYEVSLPTLQFNQVGSKVSVQYNNLHHTILFTNLTTNKQLTMKLKESIEGSDKWRVFFGINENDKIVLEKDQ